jgi:TatD DNase family protein
MWIDSHCHLDFIINEKNSIEELTKINNPNIDYIICPSADDSSFKKLIDLNKRNSKIQYAFGYHPLFLEGKDPDIIQKLVVYIEEYNPIAIGEIGLDFYVKNFNKNKQIFFFEKQLELASKYNLPVILHVRSAIDNVINILKCFPKIIGVAHAFNGSFQQAEILIDMGFKLGFGGAMTFERAKKIRMLAKELPLNSIVLETDAPDMNPAWLNPQESNHPCQIQFISEFFSEHRGLSLNDLSWQLKKNINEIFVFNKAIV